MTPVDHLLEFAEKRRATVCAISAAAVVVIAWADWTSPETSFGFLYLVPVLFSAAALNSVQILMLALVCGYLREALDPLQWHTGVGGPAAASAFNPLRWVDGSYGRLLVAAAGFAMAGFFVTQLNQRRRLLAVLLHEREQQMVQRHEAEMRVRTLIETSPLAILTLDGAGRVVLANRSAEQLFGLEGNKLEGRDVAAYLPILSRMLQSQHTGHNVRTSVECRGQRSNGEVFLAHVWLSTYRTSAGPGLAAVVWDASENLRDRESAGLDSMMATSRVVIGALCHEIRNLASTASSAHTALGDAEPRVLRNEHYQAVLTLIRGPERIASCGLSAGSRNAAAAVDLGTVLDETRIVIEPSLEEAGIDVKWEIRGPLPLVQADHHSLLQVFINLARNSRDAMQNCERRELCITAAVEDDVVAIRFRDTGPGVASPEDLFQPFQHGSQSSGLGLYISRAILRSEGGGLRYEPSAAGACFVVELWPVERTEG